MADGAGSTAPPSRLAQFLTASRSCDTPEALAEAWCDSTVTLRLARAGRIAPKIGPHLRRSFLGALGPAASIEAQNGEPCPWDPPCALDLFCREQMRDTRGNGLPKPYVLWAEADGPDLMVSLRLFGIAGDWALGASEALITGLRDILPWDRLGTHLPAITERHIEAARITSSPPPLQLRLYLLSPMDISGRNPTAEPWEHPDPDDPACGCCFTLGRCDARAGDFSGVVTGLPKPALWSGRAAGRLAPFCKPEKAKTQ